MIYIMRDASEGAKWLTARLNELRAGSTTRVKGDYGRIPARTGDLLVNWGVRALPRLAAGRVLNRVIAPNKLAELDMMHAAGVRVPSYILSKPSTRAHGEWIPRTLGHENGDDFKRYLAGERNFGDYYTKKIDLVEEHRVHIFNDRVIKSNTRVAERGSHPWIRSEWGLGAPDGVTDRIRAVARFAVAAVGYDFGAVDLGVSNEDVIFVLEVNSSPWLGTKQMNIPAATAYAKAILEYAG